MPDLDQSDITEQSQLREIVTKLANSQKNRGDACASFKIAMFYKQDSPCWFAIIEASFTQMRIMNKKSKEHALIA